MTDSNSLTPLRNEDYDAIENAVMETARGRWFLAEYTKRHRSADTEMLLDAIRKLEKNMKREGEVPNIDAFKLDIADMANAIERTKKEIAQIADKGETGGRIIAASNELDAIVEHTESATQEILNTAESVQELCFEMREAGVDEKLCDRLEEFTTNIYMACSFQDLTGQRTQKVVHVLRYLESRVNAMINIWHVNESDVQEAETVPVNEHDTRPDAHLLNGPQMAGDGVDQDEIDSLLATGMDSDANTDATDGSLDAVPAESGEVSLDADIFDVSGDPDMAFSEEDFAGTDDGDFDSFEAEAMEEAEADDAEITENAEIDADLSQWQEPDDVEMAAAEDDADVTIENDLDFAAIEEMEAAEAESGPDGDADATASMENPATEDEADIFDMNEVAPANSEDTPAPDENVDDFADADVFEGADVFEVASAKPTAAADELTMEDLTEGWSETDLETDPTLELTTGERLALFH